MGTPSTAVSGLASLIERWADRGIISRSQAERIRADVALSMMDSTPRRPSIVVEALGYLGGVIVLVGLGLVTGQFWDSFSAGTRTAVAGGVAAVLALAGGGVTGRDGTGARLRSVTWAASAVALFVTLILLSGDGLGFAGDSTVLVAAGVTTLAAAAMWAGHRQPLQHAVFFVGLTLTAAAAAAVAMAASLAPMSAVWLVGALWCVLGATGLVHGRRSALILGTGAGVIGSVAIGGEVWGSVLALGGLTAVIVVAVRIRDLAVLAVASVGALVVLPSIVLRHFPGIISAALTLVTAGLLLVGVAVYTARRRPAPSRPA